MAHLAPTHNKEVDANHDVPGSLTSATEVAWQFCHEYYNWMHNKPDTLYKFYGDSSVCVHGDEGVSDRQLFGAESIHKKIEEGKLKDCQVKVSNVDAQSSIDGVILIQVLGEMANNGGHSRRFVQTFLLAGQEKGYYVRNDIRRFLKEDADDVEEEEEENTNTDASVSAQEPALPAADVGDTTIAVGGAANQSQEPVPSTTPAPTPADSRAADGFAAETPTNKSAEMSAQGSTQAYQPQKNFTQTTEATRPPDTQHPQTTIASATSPGGAPPQTARQPSVDYGSGMSPAPTTNQRYAGQPPPQTPNQPFDALRRDQSVPTQAFSRQAPVVNTQIAYPDKRATSVPPQARQPILAAQQAPPQQPNQAERRSQSVTPSVSRVTQGAPGPQGQSQQGQQPSQGAPVLQGTQANQMPQSPRGQLAAQRQPPPGQGQQQTVPVSQQALAPASPTSDAVEAGKANQQNAVSKSGTTWANLAANDSNKWTNAQLSEAKGHVAASHNRDQQQQYRKSSQDGQSRGGTRRNSDYGAELAIYIKHVTQEMTYDDLKNAFKPFGQIEFIDIIHPKSCAFLEFKEPDSARKAIAAGKLQIGNTTVGIEERRGNRNHHPMMGPNNRNGPFPSHGRGYYQGPPGPGPRRGGGGAGGGGRRNSNVRTSFHQAL